MTYGRTARRLCQDARGIHLRSRTAGIRLFGQCLQSALSAFFRCRCRPVSLDASDVVWAGCRSMVRKHVSLCQPSLRVGTPIDCFGIAPPVRFSFDQTLSSLFTAGFYNLGKPSPSIQHRFKHRRNLPCRLQSDLGFAPAAGVGFRPAGTGRSDGGGEVETWILAGVVFRVSDDTYSAKMHSEWQRPAPRFSTNAW